MSDVFGIPGGVVLDFLYAMNRRPSKITTHLNFHEQNSVSSASFRATSPVAAMTNAASTTNTTATGQQQQSQQKKQQQQITTSATTSDFEKSYFINNPYTFWAFSL